MIKRSKMEGTELTEFREKHFPGKLSQEKMATVFGVKYNTLRRYEGRNPMPIPEVLAMSIKFYGELQEIKTRSE
jgi:DNA-binding transcriptional regulator YiaG